MTTATASRTAVSGREFMIVTAHPLATEAGFAVLAEGGSAADAAVALQMVLNLVEPQSSGIGGGGFVLYWDAATGTLTTFDGRETAPAAATPDYWLNAAGEPLGFWDAVVGGRSVGVPGTVLLMETLHQRYGRLPWGELFAPAIGLAEEGFPISPRLAAAIPEARALDQFTATRNHFFRQDGSPLGEGDLLRSPDFAATLRLIAAEGSEPFYHGPIARDIVAAVQTETNPGVMTLEDLAGYEVRERPAVCQHYRAYEVCGMGPPSSGGLTVGQMLGMLSAFDLPALGPGAQSAHLFLEAGKLAFADRGLYMADSDFVDMPEGLLNGVYLAGRAALIDPGHAMETPARPGEPPWEDAQLRAPDQERPNFGTTHFVIVDSYGNLLSATTTIETGFGSRVMTGGFLLNNELTDFAFVPEVDGVPVANRVEGGKRPRSSMSPTIVFRGDTPVLLIGSPGGANIIPYVAGALVGILDFGLDPQTAVDRPHALNLNGPSRVEAGDGAEALIEALAEFGHAAEAVDLNSGLHAILIGADGALTGAADRRREGLVMGN
jgi:gamma-glutamyltranspeptidase/glutathione hydrolase